VQLDPSRQYDLQPVRSLLRKHEQCVYPRVISFAGVDLLIERDVFGPDLTKTSILMIDCLAETELKADWRVVDAFTGSGVLAMYCALRGCSVIAVDHSSNATRCALANAKRNGVEAKVDVRVGDSLSVLRDDEMADLIIATPPLLPGVPTNTLETAVFDPNLAATFGFIREVPNHLSPRGAALLMLSDVFQRMGNDIHALARESGMTAEQVRSRDAGYETYSIFRLTNLGD
jgi:methylase of polypeptide subunit release factors